MPEIVRRDRNTEDARRNGAIEVGRSRVNSVITARHSPDPTSIPAPSQVGQGSIPSIETRTGRLRIASTKTRTMTRARLIRGSVPTQPDHATAPSLLRFKAHDSGPPPGGREVLRPFAEPLEAHLGAEGVGLACVLLGPGRRRRVDVHAAHRVPDRDHLLLRWP